MLSWITRSLRRAWPFAFGGMLLLPSLCWATDVQVVAVAPGEHATVVIDRRAPVKIRVGETFEGVKVLKADRSGAVLSVGGVPRTLPLVAYRASATAVPESATVTLLADPRGHFIANGTVNGHSVRFLVDTGATSVGLSRADAERIGLDYRHAPLVQVSTASGIANGWRVSLDSVGVAGATVGDVEATVIDSDELTIGLLGMTFLDRFDMHREGSKLVLRRRR